MNERIRFRPQGIEDVQQNALHAIKVYITQEDYDAYIKSRLEAEDAVKYADCTWVPIQVSIHEPDMSIEATFVPAK